MLLATNGLLRFLDRSDGSVALEVSLLSTAEVAASPVLHDGKIYVVTNDGAVTVVTATIDGSPVDAYGDRGGSPWPRYRRNNQGLANTAL